jgi:predicted transcriptional regulator
MSETSQDLINLTADIVSAHVANNKVSTADVSALIQSVFAALSTASAPPAPEAPSIEPAVSVRSSVKQDYIVCLEDGKKLKMLKRYLRTNFGMTPEEYRQKWNLPRDYPMVAPAYAEQRRGLAKKIGLGRRPQEVEPVKTIKTATKSPAKKAVKNIKEGLDAARAHLSADQAKAPARRGRKPKAAPSPTAAAKTSPTEA